MAMPERKNRHESVRTTVTGTHAAGHHLTDRAVRGEVDPEVPTEGLVWIEREDLRKQRMARKGDMRDAQAAPNHPHLAGEPETGGRQ